MKLPIGPQIASAALLDGIFQDAPMVFRVGKADGSYATTYISPNVEIMLGCPPTEWLSSASCWQDRVHPEDLHRVMEALASLIDSRREIVEYRLLGAGGSYVWVKDEINLALLPDGTPAYLSGYWYDISAYKNQEAALLEAQRVSQEKDQFLQSVLDNIPQKLFWKDRLSVFHGCNLAGAREVGLARPEDIEGKTDFNLHHNPMVADHLRKTDEAVMAAGEATFHAAVPLNQGEVWLDVTKVPLHDESGGVNGLLISYEDVSTQRKTEIALRNFKRAVEQSSNSIIITTPEGDIEYVNPHFLEVYGYLEHEVLGKNPRLLKSSATSADTYRDMWQTILSGKSWHGELVNQAKNGQLSWQSASISPIFDENGAITHFLAIQDDISEHKRIEEALRQSEERFRTIANYTYNWENWVAPSGKLLWVNPGVERVTGYTPEECYAMTDFPIGMVYPEDREMVARHFVETLSGAEQRALEFRILHKNGGMRWGEVSLQQVHDANGTSLGHRSSVRDITARKQAEMALHTLNQTLERRVKEETAQILAQERMLIQQARHAAMGEMIGNIAHQWRQPLNTLGLVVQNIAFDYQEGILDENSLAEYKATALDTVHKMSQTIDDFRNFFRPNHPDEIFSLDVPIHEALKLINAGLQSNGIAVTVSCTENLNILGSSNEFAQVMLNLLSNAKDALLEKNASLKTIEISARAEGNQAVVRVRDNGGGIPDESMDNIFDPYFSTKECGTGIGLYMTRIIIEQHMHGIIACRNTEDGAEFTLSLPMGMGQNAGAKSRG